jgi:hypothetical protein
MIIDPTEQMTDEKEPFRYREDIIKILHEKLKSVEEYCNERNDIRGNKYVELALKYGYHNYRVCTIRDVLDLKLFKSISYYAREFVKEAGIFLIIFNELNGKPISAVFRRIDVKEFLDFSLYPCPYGLDMLEEDFKFGDYILLTEGGFDADSIRRIFKNSVSLQTSSLTTMSADILGTVTNRYILAFDNDKAGNDGIEITTKRIRAIDPKADILIMKPYAGDKDLGVMEEKFFSGEMEEFEFRDTYYRAVLGSIVSGSL